MSHDDPQDEFDAKMEQVFLSPTHRWILSADRRSIRRPLLDGYDLVFQVAEHNWQFLPHGPHLCQIGPTSSAAATCHRTSGRW